MRSAHLAALALLFGCPNAPRDAVDGGSADATDPLETCRAACATNVACDGFDLAACESACGSPVACAASLPDCDAALACFGKPLESRPFRSDGAGSNPRDLAGDLTLPTATGDVKLSELWTGDDTIVFVIHDPAAGFSKALWRANPAGLVAAARRDLHVFFLAYTETDASDRSAQHVAAIKALVDRSLSSLDFDTRSAVSWRYHYVTKAADTLEGWLGDAARERRPQAIGVDRFQRIREVGLLGRVGSSLVPEWKFVANEVAAWAFEFERETARRAIRATTIPIWKAAPMRDRLDATLQLPSLAGYDTLEWDLALGCEGHRDAQCGEWDYLMNLYLCDPADATKCSEEIGRWITPYGREGRWISPASWVLARLGEGKTTLRLTAPGQPNDRKYVVDLSLRLSTRAAPEKFTDGGAFFHGGQLAAVADEVQSAKFTLPAGATHAALAVLVTGHGFGDDADNCAEFCNHTHHFVVNGHELVIAHPEAQSNDGCLEKIGIGVVPNQFGTWPYGRGGWCPGLDVPAQVLDLTPYLVAGENSLTYQAKLDGKPYKRRPIANGSGFSGRIDLTTRLVFH